jgi:16S rRNA G966 N2-methylase RsmD
MSSGCLEETQVEETQVEETQVEETQTEETQVEEILVDDFPWRTYEPKVLYQEFHRLKNRLLHEPITLPIGRSYLGYKCTNYFFQKERLNTRGNSGTRISALEYWNTTRGKELTIKNSYKNNRDIFNSLVFLARAPAQFSLVASGTIYKYFGATHILDPYAGWGDRCLAAIALGIKYTGIDSNPNLQLPFKNMIDFFFSGNANDVTMINDYSENIILDNISYDLIFSSPPFWNEDFLVECYAGCSDKYQDFLSKSLIPLIKHGINKKIRVCLHLPLIMYQDISKVYGEPLDIIIINKTSRAKIGRDRVYCW